MKYANKKKKPSMLCAGLIALATSSIVHAQITGSTFAHDPSSLIKENGKYYYWYTSNFLVTHTSTDMVNWTNAPNAFPSIPAWQTQLVPNFTGQYWAPDITYMSGKYWLYYSMTINNSPNAAIGVASSPTLDSTSPNFGWVDHGPVITSSTSPSTPWLAIDPSIWQDGAHTYMSFGSYRDGIYITELNQTTGKMLNPSLTPVRVADNGNRIEGSSLVKHGSYYYLFVNFGRCCAGIDSTYDIRVGRSTSPTGPFLDKDGVNMLSGGGTMFLDDNGKRIGPGHFGFYTEAGQDYYSYHYYDGANQGSAAYDLRKLYWGTDNWPLAAPVSSTWKGTASNDWSNTANWDGAVPGGASHYMRLTSNSASRYNLTLDGPRTVSNINFDSSSSYTIGSTIGPTLTMDSSVTSDNVTLNAQQGDHNINAPINAIDSLAINTILTTSSITLGGPVTAPTLNKYGYGELFINNTFNDSGSALFRYGTTHITSTTNITLNLHVGYSKGEDGTLTIRDNASVTVGGEVNVGDTGSNYDAVGTLNLRDNAVLNAGTGVYIGSGNGSGTHADGTFNQSGGTFNITSTSDARFVVGGRVSNLTTGRYNLSGGTVNANTNVRIGGFGDGTMTQTGGTFNCNSNIAIGKFAGSTGIWTMTGGTLNVNNATKQINVGEAGAGTLNIDGSANLVSSGPLKLGLSGGTGTVNLNGGTITVPSLGRGTGTGKLKFDGGVLRANLSSTTFLQGLNSATIAIGGAIIDTQNNSITIGQSLIRDSSLTPIDPNAKPLDDGGLIKRGSGTLILSGTNTYTGKTSIEAGTLQFAGNQTNRTWLNINKGASAVIASPAGKSIIVSHLTIEPTGSLDVRENGILLVGGANYIAEATIRDWVADGRIKTTITTPGARVGYGNMVTLGLSSYNGIPRPNEPTLLIYQTLAGDASLDGAVNYADLMAMSRNYGMKSNATWSQGDFNYDGAVNFTDLQQLASEYGPLPTGNQLNALPDNIEKAIQLIPEPTNLMVVGMGTMMLARRIRSRI